MALRYQQSERVFTLQGSIMLVDGTAFALDADNIVRYSIDEASTAGELLTLGDMRASDFILDVEDVAHTLTAAKLIGARVTVQIGLDGTIDPLGVWYVDKAEISRQSATVSISGTDALGSKMDGLYVDGVYPTTLGAIAARAAAQAGLTLKSNSFRNSDIIVQTQPEWDVETTTQRMVIGYVAACAGGFARISRAGVLEIVPYAMTTPETVTADYFTTLIVGGGQSFSFNCLQVAHYGSNIYVRYAIDESKTDTAGNTLRVSDNPLLTAAIAQTLKTQLTWLASAAVSVDWVGDPTMQPGMRVTVQDTDGSTHTGIVTRQTISVDGGLHAQTAAELPENINSAFIDTVFTPGGKVNISAAEGRLKVWAEEQIELTVGDKTEGLQSQIDMIPGQITAAVEDVEEGLQAQIDLIPDQITLEVKNQIGAQNLIIDSKIDLTTSEYLIKSFKLTDDTLKDGETVTMQIWGSEGGDRYYWRVTNGSTTLVDIKWNEKVDGIVTKTFSWIVSGSNDTIYLYHLSQNMDSNASDPSTVEKVQLQRGDTPSAWAPSALDAATSVVSGSDLIITQDEVRINTPKFSVNVNGTAGDMTLDENGLAADVISSPSVRPMYTGPALMNVEGGETDGINTFNALSDCLAKLDGKYLPYAVTIKIFSAQTEGTIEFGGTDGEAITVVSGFTAIKPQINAQLSLRGVRNQIVFDGIAFAYAYADAIFINDCHMVVFNNCEIVTSHTASGASMYANTVWAYRSSVELHSCGVFGGYSGLAIEGNTRAFVEACYGSGNEYGIFARGNASVGVKTSRPAGNTANTYVETDSVVRGTTTVSTGTSPTVPSATTTVQIDCTNSRTYAGGWYNSSTPMVAQGVANGTTFRGYMWFDFSSVIGETIQRAAIRLYRKSGIGKSKDVDVYIGAMLCDGPGYTIRAQQSYGKITVASQKEQIKVTIPTEMLQAIANGSYNGLFVYSSSADDYAAFDGFGEAHPPALLVTY